MHRERDSKGRFIARGRSSIPTTPPTPPRFRKTHLHPRLILPAIGFLEFKGQKFNQKILLHHPPK